MLFFYRGDVPSHFGSAIAGLKFLTGFILAHVAQSVEHFLGKEEVIGSNPIVGSMEKHGPGDFFQKTRRV